MTVSKLIERLHRFDPDMPVVIRGISTPAIDIEQLKTAKMKKISKGHASYYDYADTDPDAVKALLLT